VDGFGAFLSSAEVERIFTTDLGPAGSQVSFSFFSSSEWCCT
jgi:hypothetical protein